MVLPHPHGNSSGQIGHNANYDVGDTPGSTGGKFIGFGEEGTSAVGNRAHWALSENIDYLYQQVTQDIAVPAGFNRTAADQGGGGEVSYQFPAGDTIWVGDSTYPGSAGSSDLEGMVMLFDVLDTNYNELTDGNGNEIRVKLVRESTGVTDVYQGGSPSLGSFQDQPIIYFIAVDPESGATVADPYTIPTGTNYKVMCGVRGDVANLPTDALIRFKVQSSTEVQAGTFLQDGSKKMTGNFDADGNSILNPDQLYGAAGADLLLRSQQALNLQDQYITSPVPFGESGVTALYQPSVYTSVLGTLSAQAEAQEILTANRCADRTGSITTSGADVTYPTLKVILQGQMVTIAGSTVSATGADTYVLYVEPDGTVTFEAQTLWGGTNPPARSVLIWQGDWDGATTWSAVYDMRWPGTKRGDNHVIFVGDGVGADFTSLNDAADWMNIHDIGVDKLNPVKEIVVVGEAVLDSTVTLPVGTILRGVSRGDVIGYYYSAIKSSTTFEDESHLIVANSNCIIKDLDFKWQSATEAQHADYAGLHLTSIDCLVDNVRFDGAGSRTFATCILLDETPRSGSVIRQCVFNGFSVAGVRAPGKTRAHVEYCTFFSESTGAPSYHIDFISSGTGTDSSNPAGTIIGCYFYGDRPSVAHIRVCGPNVLIDSCHCKTTGSNTTPFVLIAEDGVDPQDRAGAVIRNCLVEDGYQFVGCTISNASLVLNVLIEGCVCERFTGTLCDFSVLVANESQLVIRDNSFLGNGTTSENCLLVGMGNVQITSNTFKDWTYYCVRVESDTVHLDGIWITDNRFDSCATKTITAGTTTDVQAMAIDLVGQSGQVIRHASISNNVFHSLVGSAIRAINAYDVKVEGNTFYEIDAVYLINNGGNEDLTKCAVIYALYSGQWFLANNRFDLCGKAWTITDEPIKASCVHFDDMYGPVQINNNYFGDSKASGATNHTAGFVNDAWADVYLDTGTYNALLSGNYFYRDLTAGSAPSYEFSQVSSYITGTLVLTGCTFVAVGGNLARAALDVYHVYCDALTRIVASGCYTESVYSGASSIGNPWNLSTVTTSGNLIIGCVWNSSGHTVVLEPSSPLESMALGNILVDGTSFTLPSEPSDSGNVKTDTNVVV